MNTSPPQYPFDYYRPVFGDLARIDRLDLLEQLCDEISQHLPGCLETYDLVSYGYNQAKKYQKSVAWGERALVSSPDNETRCAVRFNLAKSLLMANYPEESARHLAENIRIVPFDTDYAIDYSVAIYAQNHKDQAEGILRSVLADPRFTSADKHKIINFNLGVHEIRHGNFRKGMKQIATGREIRVWGTATHNFPIPEWRGEPAQGKKLLVVGEGGAGDEIINVRFVKHLNDRGLAVDWASAHGLADIFARLPFNQTQNYRRFTSDIGNIRDYDYWCPAMSLPVTLDLNADDLWHHAYLSADAQYVDKWQNIVQSHSGLRIGVRWAGNPLYEQDLHRSLPVPELWNAIQDTSASFFSLQRDNNVEQISHCKGGMIDLSDTLETWDDTLAVIENLDVVITSCTSIAHAAAALGKRTVILTPIIAYYTWGEEKSNTSWYGDNVTILRQTKPRDWSGPIQELRALLKAEFG